MGRAVARAGARARGHHLGEPRRPRGRRRRALRGDHPGDSPPRPGCRVEVLIPDFQGGAAALATVIEAAPDVLNHNTETVPRLYKVARHGGRYERTLELFRRARAAAPGLATKSGIILGLGEERDELLATMARPPRRSACTILTLGQYLRPVRRSTCRSARYYHPDEFAELAVRAASWASPTWSRGPWSAPPITPRRQADGRRARREPTDGLRPDPDGLRGRRGGGGGAARHPAADRAAAHLRRSSRSRSSAARTRCAAGGPLRDQVLDHRDLLHPLRHRAGVRLAVGRRCTAGSAGSASWRCSSSWAS